MRKKLKELTKDTAVYGISTIVGRMFNFILVPFFMQFFTTEQMGIYGNIYAYIAFFNIAYIYGMDAAFLKYTSTADDADKKDVFSTPFLLILLSSTIFSIIIAIAYQPLATFMSVPGEFHYLLYYIALILLFDTLALIPFAHLRLQRKAKKFAIIKLINITINIVFNVILIAFYNFGIEAVLISNLAASAITFLMLIPDIAQFLRPVIRKDLLKKMLTFGMPYLPASISATIVQVIDRPLLTQLTDYSTTGIYVANYKLGIAMMLFVGMFQYAWQPFFLTNAKGKDAKQIFAKVLTLFVFVGAAIVLFLTLFVDNLAALPLPGGRTLIASEYWEGMQIIPIILLAYLFHGMYVNFQAGIYIEEKTKYFPIITIVGASVNIGTNLLLIPIFGYMGAAYATLASYLVMAVMLFVMVQKVYYIKYEYYKVGVILLLLILSLFFYYEAIIFESLNVFVKFLILLGFVAGLFIFKVLDKNEILSTIQLFLNKFSRSKK